MNGNGIPVGGIAPVTTQRLIIVCIAIIETIPVARSDANGSFERCATSIPRYMRITNARKRHTHPIKPISSDIIAKIKSLSANGI